MKKSEKCVTCLGGGCWVCVRSSWADLRMLIELHSILISSAITIIANRRGWRHSPCELVCTMPSWPGTKWKRLLRGQREHTTEFPERCDGGTGGGAEAPFVTQALCVPQGPCGLLPPPSPSLWRDCLCEWVMATVMRGPAWLAESNQLLPSSLSSEASQALWEPGIRQLPAILCSNDLPSLPPAVPMASFLAGHRLSVTTIGLQGCSWPEVDPALWSVLILSP